jgi:hypothetical protein
VTTGGLALSHDFTTGITNALILGQGYSLHTLPAVHSNLDAFLSSLRDNLFQCVHPLVLPTLFLMSHVWRVDQNIIEDITPKVMDIEKSIGITKSGRTPSTYSGSPTEFGRDETLGRLYNSDELQRWEAKRLTEAINDLSTRLIFVKRSPSWDLEASETLINLLKDTPRLKEYRGVSYHGILETIEFLRSYSDASLDKVQTSQSRMELQLNIVSVFV